MKPPVAYYGGKARIAGRIADLIGSHRVYVEPFCGSAAVLFAKPPASVEIINDIDANVVAFYRCMRDRTDELIEAISLTPYARDEYIACDLSADIDDLERARRWWVRSTQGFSGIVTARTTWASSSRPGATRHTLGKQKLLEAYKVADRLGSVVIESGDALDVIAKHDHPDAALYIDPPYLDSTRVDATGGYRHEMVSGDAHQALAAALRSCRGHVLLSGYRSDLYADLYDGWATLEIEMQSTAGRDTEDREATRTEVIWSNRPLVEPGAFDFDREVS